MPNIENKTSMNGIKNKFQPILRRISLEKLGLAISILLLSVIFGSINNNFFSIANLSNISRQISILAMLAVGQTFVILSGGIDLSVGSVIGLVSVVSATIMLHFGIPASIFAGLLMGLVIGLINGIIVAKIRVQAFIVTLGMLSIARGIGLIISGGMPISGLPFSFRFLGLGYIFGIPVPALIAAILMVLGHLVLTKLKIGRFIYAIGGNEEAAELSGINVKLQKIIAFALCGMLAGLAGIVQTSRVISGQPTLGEGMNLDSIAAVVIGGTSLSGGQGSMVGTFLGVIMIAVLNNGLNLMGVSSFVQMVIIGGLIIGAASLDVYYKRKKTSD